MLGLRALGFRVFFGLGFRVGVLEFRVFSVRVAATLSAGLVQTSARALIFG